MIPSRPPPLSSPKGTPFVGAVSPRLGSAMGAKPHSTHAKIHKRQSSASSTHSPQITQRADPPAPTYTRSDGPRVTYEEPPSHHAKNSAHPRVKIKPYLRKLSTKDSNTIDLSRPAAENEGLAGLGIHDYGAGSRTVSDVAFSPLGGRNRHNRSVSETSQFSTSSTLPRPSAPYMHPMRQTPRPYTPPISKSYPTSVVGSDGSEEAADIMSDEEFRYRQHIFDPARRSGSISSLPTAPAPLRLQTTGSSSRLAGSQSQTSLSNIGAASRSRGDTVNTMRSVETATSPSSRTSFDRAINFFRGRESPVDPASRAASIRAARQAYKEKEEAKERKAEKEALRQLEREERKRVKKEERQQRKSESHDEKTSVPGREYSAFTPAHIQSLPAIGTIGGPTTRPRGNTDVSKRKAAKSRWLGFVTWFRTRLLRLGRRLHLTS